MYSMSRWVFLIAAMTMMATASAFGADVGPEGTWRTTNGKLTVKVAYCGEPRICATIVAMRRPLDKEGKPKVDHENPNPALRSRPVIGLEIMSGMKPDGANRWKGTIYNADDGNSYAATARFEDQTLNVKGCWLFVCKKLHFKRLPDLAAAEPAKK
jgi:uncharacterized protein (DUF2147 family)